MKNELTNKLSKTYCTDTFVVDGRIIENNYRCGNKGVGLQALNEIQRKTSKIAKRTEPISLY